MTIIQTTRRDNKEVLLLQSALKPRTFAQTKLSQSMGTKGYILSLDGSLSEWSIEGTVCTTTASGEFMAIYGPSFSGTSLFSAIQGDKQTAWNYLHKTVSLIRNYVQNGTLPHDVLKGVIQAGPEAILCNNDGSILLLPADLYIKTLASYGITQETENRLLWIHPDAASEDPLRMFSFMVGTIAYRIIAGLTPFSPNNFDTTGAYLASLMRTEVFEPLELANWNVKPEVAQLINTLLKTSIATSFDQLLAFGSDYTLLKDPAKEGIPETQEFIEQRIYRAKKRAEQQKSREFKRKHKDVFKVFGILFLFVVILFGMYLQDLKSKPSTLGLEPLDVVIQFYEAINDLDQEIPRLYSAKGVKTDYDNFTTNLYVTSKVRESYERNGGILTPAELFISDYNPNRFIYGITGLNIEELSRTEKEVTYGVSLYLWMPLDREQKDAFIASEQSVALSIYKYTETLSLAYEKDRWKITQFTPGLRVALDLQGVEIIKQIKDGSAQKEPWAASPEEIAEAQERFN